jgi:hypothetical protein
MPIITKPSTIEKNSPAIFTLNKSDLAQITSVLNDPYFSIQTNWKNVTIYYKSSIGNQKELLRFDATLSSPTASFLVSDKARDIFQVQKIIIQDFDGGSTFVNASELNSSEFEVDMSSGSVNYVDWNIYTSGYTLGSEGGISRTGELTNLMPRSTQGFNDDFEITFEALNTDIGPYWQAGVSKSLQDPESGENQYIFYNDVINPNPTPEFRIYAEGQVLASNLSSSILSGINTFKVKRVSGVLSFYINNNQIASFTPSVNSTLYPETRLGGTITKSFFTASAPPPANLIYTRDFSQPHENPPPVGGVYSTQGWYEFGGTISGGNLILNSTTPESTPLYYAAIFPNPDDFNIPYFAIKYRLHLITGSVGNTIWLKDGPSLDVHTITSQEVQQGFIEKIMSASDPNLSFPQQNRIASYDDAENPNDGGLVTISKIELIKPYV